MAAPSYDDLYNTAKAEALVKRPELFIYEGDITDFVIAGIAAAADKAIQYANQRIRDTFLDFAEGDALTTLVDDHWGIQRQVAVAATTSLSFTRSAGSLPAGTIPAGTTIATIEDATGARVEFTTDAGLSWALSETGTKAVAATAVDAGRDGNVAAGTLTVIVDSLFDTTFTVTNAAAAAGGNEAETDAELRERARNFPATLRRGTVEALEYGAKQVASVRFATVVESSSGIVTVYVTDADGNSNVQMISDVITELETWRAAGVVVTVTGGQPVTQNVDVSLLVSVGTDAASLTTAMQAAVEAKLDKLGVGEILYRDMIKQACTSVRPDVIKAVTVNTPAADVQPGANQLIRLGTFTVS